MIGDKQASPHHESQVRQTQSLLACGPWPPVSRAIFAAIYDLSPAFELTIWIMANIQPVPRKVKQKAGLMDRLLVHLALWYPTVNWSVLAGRLSGRTVSNYAGLV